jgi:hypothetical protein
MRYGRRCLRVGLIGLGLLTSCSGGATGPNGGVLNVGISSPNGDDGAVLFTITGGPVEAVETAGLSVYSARLDSRTLRVVIAGDLSSGTIARVRIPDRDQASNYSVSINQVARRSTFAQRDPTVYRMSLTQ